VEQLVRCAAPDTVRIARIGPPLVKVANWITHLEFDWESEITAHWLRETGRRLTVAR
jgi:hypothetical protein